MDGLQALKSLRFGRHFCGVYLTGAAGDNALGDLVEAETASSPELDQAMNDPKRYFEDRGVQLPHNATVKITKSPLNVVVCLTSDDRAHTWCVVYTFAEGDL